MLTCPPARVRVRVSQEQSIPTGTGICKPCHLCVPIRKPGDVPPSLSHTCTAGQVRISGGHTVVSYLTNSWQQSFLVTNK